MLDTIGKALSELGLEYFSLHCRALDVPRGVCQVWVDVLDDLVQYGIALVVSDGHIRFRVIRRDLNSWPQAKDTFGEFDSLNEAVQALAAKIAVRIEVNKAEEELC